jgi:DNA-binding NtrC family response regulator
MHGRILIVDDDQSMCDMLADDLCRRGFETVSFGSAAEGSAAARRQPFDVLLTDLNLPGMGGLELCEHMVANRPDVPVIVITAFGSLDTAIAAMRAGAYDFVTKPVDTDLLAVSLKRAAEHRSLLEKVRVLTHAVNETAHLCDLLGGSPSMRELFAQLERTADTDLGVLVTGESGTGKELVARALHARSRRAKGPFVAINCAAVPETLLESELFGHEPGAFTGARQARKGLFLQAAGGTLLLDEIGEMPLALQPKLLRALEEHCLRAVGGDHEVPFDARVVASTNRDLEVAVEEGRFREDLFYRVNVVKLDVPPLRARGSDVLLLAQHFLEVAALRLDRPVTGLSSPAAQRLLSYSWPGNVRELRNAVERAVAFTDYEKVAVDDLPERIRAYGGARLAIGGTDPADIAPLEEVERRHILHVLDASGGNRTMAARLLGLDRKTLYRKLQAYGSV